MSEPGIPFTQYMLPHGRQREVRIVRPLDVTAMAERFIAAGGKFECELLTTGEVSLTAVKIVDDEPTDIAIEICPNGVRVPECVDALVRKATEG